MVELIAACMQREPLCRPSARDVCRCVTCAGANHACRLWLHTAPGSEKASASIRPSFSHADLKACLIAEGFSATQHHTASEASAF